MTTTFGVHNMTIYERDTTNKNETRQMRMKLKKWKTIKAWLPGLWSQVCVVQEKKPNNPLSWASLPQVSQMGATLLAPCRSSSSSRTRPWWWACPRSTGTCTKILCFTHNIGGEYVFTFPSISSPRRQYTGFGSLSGRPELGEPRSASLSWPRRWATRRACWTLGIHCSS